MRFEVNFNNENDDVALAKLGSELLSTGAKKYPPFEVHYLTINTFEELEGLLVKLNNIKGKEYAAVVSFDPATIFFDADV